MHIIFGLNLEGGNVPESYEGVNQMTLGPRGLLDLLEMRLGLPPVLDVGTARLLAYREALQEVSEGQTRFYSQSFEVDPFGSAKVLLRWRDNLQINGWSAVSVKADSPARLRDLADVEVVFSQSTDHGSEADRLNKITAAIQNGGHPQISSLDLLETLDHFPLCWRQVLELLPITQRAFPLPDHPLALPDTRLHQLQCRLLGIDIENTAEDESVQILQNAVLSRTADAVAGRLKSIANNSDSIALISRSADQSFLNQGLENLDLASIGSGNRSSHGALVQLAPLMLRLHWKPFDPQTWMTFFLHPISPIDRTLARKLASTINHTPSRKNPAMKGVMKEVVENIEDSARQKRVSKQIGQWLDPIEYEDKADTTVLADTIRNLGEWIGKRGSTLENTTERSVWLTASASMFKLATTLESVNLINREDLSRIVAEWLPNAASGQSFASELGAPHTVTNPGHLLEPVDHVIWWQPSENALSRLPWTRKEITWLNENQIHFPDSELLRSASAESSLRAILNAKQSFEFFVTPNHDSLGSGPAAIMVRVQAELGDSIVADSEYLIQTEPVPLKPLPRKTQSWQISGQPLNSRDTESFSSLSKFIYSPFEWVLNYKAKLRPGPLFDYRIMDDARRQGSLLHGFVESLLEPEIDALATEDNTQPAELGSDETNVNTGLMDTLIRRLFDSNKGLKWENVKKADIEGWVEDHWEEILELQAAHYLVSGNEAKRSELLYVAKTAVWELLNQLVEADIVEVHCEEHITDAPFHDASLGGFVDLRVVNRAGEVGVIDLKLGGASGRREELSKGRHLQLSIYGHLVEHAHKTQAHCGYFIFSSGGIMLARSKEFFKGADVVASGSADEWQQCWNEFNQLRQAQRLRFDQGLIDFKPQLSLKHWEIKDPNKYSSYLNLIGWLQTD